MRKNQQKLILQMIEALLRANQKIRSLYVKKKLSAVLELMEVCQDGAHKIGKLIENLEGEGTKTVGMLVEYHENLYNIGKKIETIDAGFVKRLENQLLKIENKIKSELKPNRIEVAFFPYKASMWDSLESVYFAAKDDPACDVYCVPIPWFDRRPDGKLGQMHYDGDQYPDTIEVTDWREYDLEARRPDVIYVHNPYDENNLVTSVHPDYYSKRLREFTECLCYIPYFVVSNDVPEHFVKTAGCVYAHKVIVQSEKVRDTYIKIFRKHFGKRFGNAKDKFVALGSPKFDKVLNSKPEDFKIPEVWGRLIKSADGTNKKVIFYNTSIEGILKNNEQYLKKIRSVLNAFKNRNDVVLWWRPHPLSKQTLDSMRPQLAAKYMSIVDEYKRDGYGIYDDTPDVHRAIACTDAYYGDNSSLVTLYAVTGKLLMLQNVDITVTDIFSRPLTFANLFDYGGYYWFTAMEFNGLFRVDKISWKAEYIGSFPNEEPDGFNLYSDIVDWDGCLYFTPTSAKEIAVYDTISGIFDKIKFDLPLGMNSIKFCFNNKVQFRSAKEYDGSIYFVGLSYPGIMKLNPKDRSLKYFDTSTENESHLHKKSENEFPSDPNKYIYCVNALFGKEKIFMPMSRKNAVIIFNIKTETHQVCVVGDRLNRYVSMCFDGKNYWLAPRHETPVVRWNSDSDEVTEIATFPTNFDGGRFSFHEILSFDGSVHLFPNHGNKPIKIDFRKNIMEIDELFLPECIPQKREPHRITARKFLMARQIGNKIFTVSGKDSTLIEYSLVSGKHIRRYVTLDTTKKESVDCLVHFLITGKTITGMSKPDCQVHEKPFTTIRQLIHILASNDSVSKGGIDTEYQQIPVTNDSAVNSDSTTGKIIYNFTKHNVDTRR